MTDKMLKVDTAAIKQLATILDEANLSEIEYAEGETRVRLSRQQPAAAPFAYAPAAPVALPAAPAAASAPAGPAEVDGEMITSPMVGTAYLAPEPGAKAFVNVGDNVKAGDTLLIIEAMKVMNPIKAAKAGTIKKIVVTDTKPVEFGEPLLVIG